MSAHTAVESNQSLNSVSPGKCALLLISSDPFRPHTTFLGNRTTEFAIRRSWSLHLQNFKPVFGDRAKYFFTVEQTLRCRKLTDKVTQEPNGFRTLLVINGLLFLVHRNSRYCR